jgi:hypothetical protein
MTMKEAMSTILLGLCLASAGCMGGGRVIRRVQGCDSRLASPEKRVECRACVERPRPHDYLPDRLDGERCVPR